jgi:hypothetical protein
MDSSELLRLQLAKKLECSRIGYASGPIGPTGPAGTSGLPKVFTLYLDYSSSNSLSRIYIPPGFSTTPSLAAGGIFTSNVDSDLVFLGTTNIYITNTTYAYPIGLSGTGYITSGYWSPIASSYLGGSLLTWQHIEDNVLNMVGVTGQRVNGANVSVYPNSGVLSGWLGTLTISYL